MPFGISCKRCIGRILASKSIGTALRSLFKRTRIAGFEFPLTSHAVDAHRVAALLLGIHERHERRFIRHVISGDRDVLELGASIGATSLEILRRLKCGRRLLTVEANPRLAAHLRGLLALHGAGRAELEMSAVGPSGTHSVWFDLCEQSLGSKIVPIRGPTSVRVPVVSLDALAARLGPKFDLVADIEGAERWLLDNAAFLDRVMACVIELHETGIEPYPRVADLLTAFLERGFQSIARANNVVALVRPSLDRASPT